MRSYTLALAAAAAAVTAVPAAAQAEDTPSVTVVTADLDLTSARGVARLDRRIRNAAAQVCGPVGSRTLAATEAATRCREAATQGAGDELRNLVAAASQRGVQMAGQVTVRRK